MRKIALLIMVILFFSAPLCYAGLFDDILRGIGVSKEEGLDDDTVISGLKEALSISTDKAVKSVSQIDGYFGNLDIRILMPENVQKVADVLKMLGFQKQVDDFILSMNRAAEKAAPKATSFFVDAIKEMTFEDARKILDGGDTAATEYFESKTFDKLYDAFKPIVSTSMDEVGVTRSYKAMMDKNPLPLVSEESLDLDHYVTTKALDGLFHMVAQEEKNIRTDPAARVTELLRKVFGK